MTLIKMYFTSQLSSLVTSISNKIAGKSLGDMAIEALLYSKFSSAAQHIKPLIFELEKRASQNADEYAALLAECHASWFAARNALLSDRITQEVSSMEPYTADLIKLVSVKSLPPKLSRF